MSYQSIRDTFEHLEYAFRDNSGWHIQIVDRDRPGWHSSIALDMEGFPHISYGAISGCVFIFCDLDLRYAYLDVNGWHTQTVDTNGSAGNFTSLAIDTDGYPHISYLSDTVLKYAHWDGNSWLSATVDAIGITQQPTSLQLDSNDYPHISYFDGTNNDLKYAYWDGNNWNYTIVDSVGSVGWGASLALDDNDLPHISYRDALSESLKYAAFDTNNWYSQTVVSEDNLAGATFIALDKNDQPHISYAAEDCINYPNCFFALKYVFMDDINWHSQTLDILSIGFSDADKAPLALDTKGQPHIGYHVGAVADLQYVYRTIVVGPNIVTIDGPITNTVESTTTLTATVTPISTTLPLEYLWQTAGQTPITHTGGLSDVVSFVWDMPGVYTVTVTASNEVGSVSTTHTINIEESIWKNFLPYVVQSP
jgi:hypothetical protein